jgi:hypothetical protein
VTPGTGLLRLTRAAIFAVSAVGLALAAHLAAGGGVPLPIALLSVPAVMLVINRLAAGRRGPVGLFVGMGLTQIVLHQLFTVTSIAPTCAASPSMGAHGHLAMACDPMSGHGSMAENVSSSGWMTLAHVLATLALVVLLARGEAVVWALAACLRFRFVLPEAVPGPPAVRQLPVPTATARRVRGAVHLRTVRRRGPPMVASAVL